MSDAVDPAHNPDQPELGHETTDANVPAIVWSALVIIGCGILIGAGTWWFFDLLHKAEQQRKQGTNLLAAQESTRSINERLDAIRQPRLEGLQPVVAKYPWAMSSERLRSPSVISEQARQLEQYGWVDREHGIVHVPIDLAMKLMIRQGYFPVNQETGKSSVGVDSGGLDR
jgi:hypothetical protein